MGRSGDPDLASAAARYVERASRFVPVETVLVKEETPGKKPDPTRILREEGRRLAALLRPRDLLVCCDAGGKELTSEELAVRMRGWLDESPSALCFAVGGAFGLDRDLLRKARAILPLSRLTLPHQLARLVLAEQIYRGLATLHGVAYSK